MCWKNCVVWLNKTGYMSHVPVLHGLTCLFHVPVSNCLTCLSHIQLLHDLTCLSVSLCLFNHLPSLYRTEPFHRCVKDLSPFTFNVAHHGQRCCENFPHVLSCQNIFCWIDDM